jgi:uncharacterized membrane protein YeaQ/YmgE (transglycosylase-associated protein family)
MAARTIHHLKERVMIGFILYLLVVGLVAGFLARLLVPGRDPMSLGATVVLGIVGSLIGGFLGHFIFHHGSGFVQPAGWIGSIVGSVIALLVLMQFDKSRA